jgi:hypothetical protein
MSFPVEFESLVADLARREAICCAFLDISTSTAGGELVVEVTSSNPGALRAPAAGWAVSPSNGVGRTFDSVHRRSATACRRAGTS